MTLIARHFIIVRSSPEAAWAKLVDIEHWPEWDTQIEWAQLDNGIKPGSRGQLKVRGNLKVPFRVTEVAPLWNYTSEARIGWLRLVFEHHIEQMDGGVGMAFAIRVEGCGANLFAKFFGPTTRRHLPEWMKNFKRQIEPALAEIENAESRINSSKRSLKMEKAILAGGCFWGMEDLFRTLPGVVSTEVGYTGGDVRNATYENHGTHAEALEINFDPTKTSYRKLLEFFFQIHNPTTPNRQGNDIGTSYRSAIFYLTPEQKKTAESVIADITASKKWPGPIVTEVQPASDFWSAEEYHQDYLQKNPGGYTCHYVRPDWKLNDQ